MPRRKRYLMTITYEYSSYATIEESPDEDCIGGDYDNLSLKLEDIIDEKEMYEASFGDEYHDKASHVMNFKAEELEFQYGKRNIETVYKNLVNRLS